MPETCHLRCDTCKSEVIANSLDDALDKIICSQDGGAIDDTCRIALKANGKPVFSIVKIKNNTPENFTPKPEKDKKKK